MRLRNWDWHWIYWTGATALLAAVVHFAIVLFLPGIKTARHIHTFDVTGDIAQLEQISVENPGESLLALRNPDMSYAFCRFDLGERPLKVSARFPASYWSIGVYNDRGDNVYILNDRQAGVSRLELILVDGSDDAEQATESVQADEKTIIVPSATRTGVVVFRAFVATRSEREGVEQVLANSSCETA